MTLEELINYLTAQFFSIKFSWLEYEGLFQVDLEKNNCVRCFGKTPFEALVETCQVAINIHYLESWPEFEEIKL